MKTIDLSNKRIVISRTDSIGDVVLTLPMCAWLKKQFPGVEIIFLGRNYTVEVLRCYPFIDEIVAWDEWEKRPFKEQKMLLNELKVDAFFHVFPRKEIARLAKAANIHDRIGTSHRLFHWLNCNIKPNFTRKDSDFHESQLNFELLRKFGVTDLPTIPELIDLLSSFEPKAALNTTLEELVKTNRKKIILHPKSQGSAVEWPLEKYIDLANQLVKNDYRVYFSGTEKEGLQFRDELPANDEIIDVSGKSSLGEFITFISKCDGLVACSTGPLHLAAILNKKAIGLYTDLRPMHPGRWAPLGKRSKAITKGKSHPELDDINLIEVNKVLNSIIENN